MLAEHFVQSYSWTEDLESAGFTSSLLYYSKYMVVGDGVLQVDQMMYNFGDDNKKDQCSLGCMAIWVKRSSPTPITRTNTLTDSTAPRHQQHSLADWSNDLNGCFWVRSRSPTPFPRLRMATSFVTVPSCSMDKDDSISPVFWHGYAQERIVHRNILVNLPWRLTMTCCQT